MTEEQNNIIRQLIKEKRYEDARFLLLKIKGDPTAQKWLNAIEDMHPREGKFRPFKFDMNTLIVTIVLIVSLSLFIIFIVASIISYASQ